MDFVFEYDPALLNVTGIFCGADMPGDWGIVYNLGTPGHVPVTLSGSSPLPAGQIRLADIQASVPSDAVYALSAVLSLSSIHVNKGTIAVEGGSGVQVVAYFGDATGNYAYSSLDASYISRVAAGLDSGFAAIYRVKDPVILGDVTGNGRLSALDVAYVARKAAGMDVSYIPDLAGTLQPFIVLDPLLSIPSDLSAYPGSTVTVPILLDDATDLIAADIYLSYDTNVFDVTNSDIHLGDLTSGWSLLPNVNDATGSTAIILYGTIFLSGGSGSIVEIDFDVRADAPAGVAVIDLLDSCALNEGELVLTLQDREVTIIGLNNDPIAVNDEVMTDEDSSVIVTGAHLLDNDSDPDVGDVLEIAEIDTTGVVGVLIDNGDGTYTYDPDGHFDYLAGGESTTQIFSYRVDDGKGGQATAEVTITITGVNDVPVANDDSATTDEDTPVTVDVLANDSDLDGDTLVVTSVTTPANGIVVINADNTVTYTPDSNYNGIDSFYYTISDGQGGSNTATVTVTMNAANDAPVANNDSYTTSQDTTLVIPALGILANDIDADGDTLTAVLNSAPSNGSLTLNADGSFTYTPDASFTGVDTFTYYANGSTADSNIATVMITVYIPTPTQVVVDDLVRVSGDTVRYDRQTGQSSVEFTITNTSDSDTAIEGPIWLVIENISDPDITLVNSDGMTADGKLYIDLTTHLDGGQLDPGESVKTRLYFNNPDLLRFTLELSVLGVILP